MEYAECDLHVAIAYEGIPAAVHAVDLLNGIVQQASPAPKLHLYPWNFGMLGHPLLRARSEAEGAKADLIILGFIGRRAPLAIPVEAWLRTCLGGGHATQPAVAALFPGGGRTAMAMSPRLRKVRQIARESGCTFLGIGSLVPTNFTRHAIRRKRFGWICRTAAGGGAGEDPDR